MIALGVLLSSVAATTLAMLAAISTRLTAGFRHQMLLVAIVLVPLATLAMMALLLWMSDSEAPFEPELAGLLKHVDFSAATVAVRTALTSTPLPFGFQHLYAAISLMLLIRVALDAYRTGRHVRRARELPSLRLNVPDSAGISFRESARAGSPFAWGAVRPVVVIPPDWSQWSEQKRLAVVSHECAHIRRRDVPTTLLSLLACCVLWVNPFIWLAHRRLRQESERACDDAVVARGVAAPTYAGYLLEIARSENPGPAPAMATRSTLARRVEALLDPTTRRLEMSGRYTYTTLATALTILSGCSAGVGVSAGEEQEHSAPTHPSAAIMLKSCGQHLPADSKFVMELSADWNTEPSAQPGEAFELSFTFGDRNRPDRVGEIPEELHPFAQCLHKALTHQDLPLTVPSSTT